MSFLSLVRIELKKIRRSKMLLLLTAATVICWLPSVLNADMNFGMQAEGISPESNFLIQGFMGMAWFMFPACMVVGTVLLNMTERSDRGILKMLSLPVNTARLCLAKFAVMFGLAAFQTTIAVLAYFVSAWMASYTQNYQFVLPIPFVLKEAGLFFASAIPMTAFFWMLAVCIKTPIFSVGIGLASIVPSVLLINTEMWFVYPMSYPFYIITAEYGKLAANISTPQVELIPWVPAAIGITAVCLLTSCMCFGRSERR